MHAALDPTHTRHPLARGAYHEHGWVTVDGRDLVLRRCLATQWGLTPCAQLAREHSVLLALESTGVAPRPVALCGDVLVEEMIRLLAPSTTLWDPQTACVLEDAATSAASMPTVTPTSPRAPASCGDRCASARCAGSSGRRSKDWVRKTPCFAASSNVSPSTS